MCDAKPPPLPLCRKPRKDFAAVNIPDKDRIKSNVKWKRMANEKLPPIPPPDQVQPVLRNQRQKLQNQSPPPNGDSTTYGFWTSERRQYVVIAAVNLVTFLQGASLPTTSVSLPRMANETEDITNETTTWPADFIITDSDGQYIKQAWLYAHLISGLLSNPIAEMIGRKNSLLLDCFAFFLGFFLYGAAENVETMCVARALLGYPLVNTVYLFELTHVDMRGLSAAMFALSAAVGYSALALFGAVTPEWRFVMWGFSVLSLVAAVAIFFLLPESPIWLLRKDRVKEAEEALKKVRGVGSYEDEFMDLKIKYEMNVAQAQGVSNPAQARNWSVPMKQILTDMFAKRRMIPTPPFSFGFLAVLFVFVGWSGFTHITFNGVKLFQSAVSIKSLDEYTMNFLVSLAKIPGGLFAAVFLKRFSNRPVFLASTLLVVVSHITMGMVYLDVLPSELAMVAIATALFAFSAGYSSVSNLLLGVLLPSSSRSTFVGLVATIEGLSALSQSLSTPAAVAGIGNAGLFFVFAGIVAACAIFMFFMMPETKGVSLEQIEYIFLCPPTEGCVIRRDPARTVTQTVQTIKRVSRALRVQSLSRKKGRATISDSA